MMTDDEAVRQEDISMLVGEGSIVIGLPGAQQAL